MKVAVILGTRPEIIKLAPVIKELNRQKISNLIIHSGQHYSYNLDQVFFRQLSLPKPKYKLEVGSVSPGQQISLIIERAEKILKKENPDIVLVQGDTNTVLGGALVAKKLGIKVGHVEAGLRSYDERMPEELNRRLADHCSDLLFVPTKKAKEILVKENVSKKKIILTGNTIVDSINASKKIKKFEKIEYLKKEYFLVSVHRQENVDDAKRFKNIVKGLHNLKKEYRVDIVFPIHPRSKKMAKKYKISLKGIETIEPVNYLQFIHLQKNARLVLTDSGGVQEETCILKIPCVTLRDNTERPETIEVGANMLAGTKPQKISKVVKKMLNQQRKWKNPFGDGKASLKIINAIKNTI